MAHDVFLLIFDYSYPLHSAEYAQGLYQAALHGARKVDLRGVAGDDHLRVVAEAGEKHLHLVFGRVLSLVKDDYGVVERTSAHEGKRGYLYGVGLHVFLELHLGYHVFERIVKGAQVWIDLVLHVAGEETEFLARLHGRAREEDAAALTVFERGHGERDGDVGLARTGGTEGEGKVVFGKRLHHLRLVGVARSDGSAVLPKDDHALGIDGLRRIALYDVDDHVFGEFIVFHRIFLYLVDLLLEIEGFRFLTNHLDHVAACGHAQLREEIADKVNIIVVDPVECMRVNLRYYYSSFVHIC